MKKLNVERIKEELRGKVAPFAADVAPLYEQLKWTWHGGDLPTESLITATLHELIDNIRITDLTSQHPGHWVSSGGLTVGYEITRNSNTLLSCVETFIKFTKSIDTFGDINPYMEEI